MVAASAGRPKRGLCGLPGCGKPHWAKGYCKTHVQRLYRHGTLDLLGRWSKVTVCPSCGESVPPNAEKRLVRRGIMETAKASR